MAKVYVLNVPVLPNYGKFNFQKISIEEAREIVAHGFTSAVGHQATADILSQLLGVKIPYNRIRIQMEPGDKAIVFRLLVRLPEGKVLSEEEIRSLPWELGLLTREE